MHQCRRTDARLPMDRPRACPLERSDAGMKARTLRRSTAERVVGAAVEAAAAGDAQRRAGRVQRTGGAGCCEPHRHTLAALIAVQPDRTLAELKDALGTPASLATIWRAVSGPSRDRQKKRSGPPNTIA